MTIIDPGGGVMSSVQKHLSVSQYNTFVRCPYSWYLQRVKRVWVRPASWLSQGLGVHKAMEEWEKSGRELNLDQLRSIYVDEYCRSVNEQAEITPDFTWWFGSGPYDGEQDIERRFKIGLEQLEKLVQYSLDDPDTKIWSTPDGDQAIELEFHVKLGDQNVKGFIDQIVETPKGLVCRDIKTGAKPGDIFQLTVYAEAMKILYDVDVVGGDYFMGKTGKPTKLIPIRPSDRADVHEQFDWLAGEIVQGNFEPKPEVSKCRMCSVKDSCEYRYA